jgi:CheY-like chemotaxis protein
VLVVDDSISVRKVVTRHLQAMGLEVDEVSDGMEALGRLRARPYGLVVTDLEMPRIDGFELLSEMKQVDRLASIPVIVVSTRVDDEARQKVAALGARAMLPKPVDSTGLVGAIAPLIPRGNRPCTIPEGEARAEPRAGKDRRKPRPPHEPMADARGAPELESLWKTP